MPKADWSLILSDYEHRDCTQKEFCERRGVTPAMLQYHLGKLKKSRSFVPVELTPPSGESVVLEFANGLKLTIHAS